MRCERVCTYVIFCVCSVIRKKKTHLSHYSCITPTSQHCRKTETLSLLFKQNAINKTLMSVTNTFFWQRLDNVRLRCVNKVQHKTTATVKNDAKKSGLQKKRLRKLFRIYTFPWGMSNGEIRDVTERRENLACRDDKHDHALIQLGQRGWTTAHHKIYVHQRLQI